MKKLVAVLLTFLIILTGCNTVKVTKVEDENNTDALKFNSEYKKVSKDNIYKYVIYDNLKETLTSGTGIIFLSYPRCSNCQLLAQSLNDIAKEKQVKEISYYNFKEIMDNNTEEYQELLDILKDNVEDEIVAPTVIFVKDGVIIHTYTSFNEEDEEAIKKYIDEIYLEETTTES